MLRWFANISIRSKLLVSMIAMVLTIALTVFYIFSSLF